jgi:hypothetical protein
MRKNFVHKRWWTLHDFKNPNFSYPNQNLNNGYAPYHATKSTPYYIILCKNELGVGPFIMDSPTLTGPIEGLGNIVMKTITIWNSCLFCE